MNALRGDVLVIVDMQTVLVSGAYREEQVLHRLQDLISKARQTHLPIIFIQHNHSSFAPMMKGEPGWQIHTAIAPQMQDTIIEKEASDAFYQTNLHVVLNKMGAQTILLSGMQTEYCVDATARSALSHNFNVILLADCHTTGNSTWLSAQKIIEHHNQILPGVAHPTKKIQATISTEVGFT